jgi:preprotein translocase subunit SecG
MNKITLIISVIFMVVCMLYLLIIQLTDRLGITAIKQSIREVEVDSEDKDSYG